MQIKGLITKIEKDFFTLKIEYKSQDIDVFYTKSRKDDVAEFTLMQIVVIEVLLQSISVNGENLGKFWLDFIIQPSLKKSKTKSDSDWAKRKIGE